MEIFEIINAIWMTGTSILAGVTLRDVWMALITPPIVFYVWGRISARKQARMLQEIKDDTVRIEDGPMAAALAEALDRNRDWVLTLEEHAAMHANSGENQLAFRQLVEPQLEELYELLKATGLIIPDTNDSSSLNTINIVTYFERVMRSITAQLGAIEDDYTTINILIKDHAALLKRVKSLERAESSMQRTIKSLNRARGSSDGRSGRNFKKWSTFNEAA